MRICVILHYTATNTILTAYQITQYYDVTDLLSFRATVFHQCIGTSVRPQCGKCTYQHHSIIIRRIHLCILYRINLQSNITMRQITLLLILIFNILLNINPIIGQVAGGPTVNINSGNPAFPFPQFLEYKEGKTVAKYNGEGVTHADMEKTIREAWQTFANEFRYTNETVDGVKYIRGNRGCPYDCTEGSGYSLLGAAYMADKTTFDGLWMRTHDHFMVKDARYIDGVVNCPDYKWGKYSLSESCLEGTAADGDWDVGLALLVAYKQWGEKSGITVKTASGTKEMSYLEEAYKVISAFVDTTRGYSADGQFVGYNTGDIGVDGYPKGGNKQKEATNWAETSGGKKYNSEVMCGSMGGYCPPNASFASYIAPAYYRSFADFLESNNGTQWTIEQFKRAEASTEWLMGQAYAQGKLPYLGSFLPNSTGVVFTETDPAQGKTDGESFRMAWRTIINELWRGQGRYVWDPATHQYTAGSTNYMKQHAVKISELFRDNGICDALGASPDPISTVVNQKGISQMRQYHYSSGIGGEKNWTNYTLGSSAAAIVLNGNEGQIADLFRQLELKWDDKEQLTEDQTNPLTSEPKYFHGWFRLLGLMILSGNHHAPENIVAKANLKVYMSVDKTFGYIGDELIYNVDYRNYGSVAATGSVITVNVSAQYEIIDAGGGTISGNTITYSIGSVPGFQTATGIVPTKGQKTYKVRIVSPKTTDRVCQTASISCSNGFGWTSNEYPNNVTYTMERNCVDILGERSLLVNKYGNRTEINPGMKVDFTIQFSNSSEGGWLNGGRNYVNFTYGWSKAGDNSYFHVFRTFTNAQEAYIDLSKYRVSYYMFDKVNRGIYNATSNPTGWSLKGKNLQTGELADFDFKGEDIPFGQDAFGKWDQRVIIKFPPDITAPTHTVLSHLGNRFQLHKGALKPIWYDVQMESTPASPLFGGRMQDDWSFDPNAGPTAPGTGNNPGLLVGPAYADINNLGVEYDRFDRDACTAFFTPDKIFRRLLVEEYDGYVWRRVAGEGPMPGREMEEIVIYDTLPKELKFNAWIKQSAQGINAELITSGGYEIIVWKMDKMLVGVNDSIRYSVIGQGTCPGMVDNNLINRAWIESKTDSKIPSEAKVKLTCGFIAEPVGLTTMKKSSDKLVYDIDEKTIYTIDYEQTLGTISKPAMNDATRWPQIAGTPPTFGTEVDFNQGQEEYVYEKYTHGKNGAVIMNINHDASAPFSILLRHPGNGDKNAGIRIEFEMAIMSSNVNMYVYENNVLIDKLLNEGYGAPYTDAKFKIELKDNIIKIWINQFNTLPFYTFSGLTYLNSGYVGFGKDNWNKPKILSWDAHFDSAFELEISDLLPADVTFVSASDLGSLTGNRIAWPKIQGPMLYGEKLKYTLTGKLASCPANGKIINNSFANPFGYKVDSIGAQSVASCGSCNMPSSILLNLRDTIVCGGNPMELTASAEPSTIVFNYQLIKDGTAVGTAATSSNFTISADGSYSVLVTDPLDPTTCFLSSDAISVAFVPDPSVKITSDTSVCSYASAVPLAITPAGTPGTWSLDGTAGTSFGISGMAEGKHELIYNASVSGCPFGDTVNFWVFKTPAPTPKDTYSALFGSANPLMELEADPLADEVAWFASASNYPSTPLATGNTYTSTETAADTYTYYFAQKMNGCWSDAESLDFEITNCPLGKPVIADIPLCLVNGKATLYLTSLNPVLSGADYFNWKNAAGTALTSDQEFTADGEFPLYVYGWSDASSCEGPATEFKVTVSAEPAASIALGSTVCYLAAKEIGADPAGSGTWEFELDGNTHTYSDIDAVRDGLSSGQAYDLAWTYTETATGCSATGKQDFTVMLPAEPVAADITANVQNLPHEAVKATAAGDVTWFSDECTTSIGTGTEPGLQFIETTDLWLNQIIGGCSSSCVKMTVTVNDCGVAAPALLKAEQRICQGEALPVFSVVPDAGLTYTWSYPADTKTGNTYTINESAPDTYTATVTANDGSCTGPGTEAVLVIESKPEPKVTANTDICFGESATAVFDPSPETGSSFTIDGTGSAFTDDLSLLAAGAHALVYHYVSAAGCMADASADINVIKTAAPLGSSIVEIVSETPKGLLDAKETVNWYGPDNITVSLGSSQIYTHPDVSSPGQWNYYITRTGNGCESEPAVFTYEITDCATPAPDVSAPSEICAGSDIVFTAARDAAASKVSWYTSAGTFLADGDTYTVTAPIAGKHTYYATQTGTCEGARLNFEFTVLSIAAPNIIAPASAEICSGAPAPDFIASGAPGTKITWHAGTGGTGTVQNSGPLLSVSAAQYAIGANTYSASAYRVLASGETCTGQAADISFKVNALPAAPVMEVPAPTCYGKAPLAAGTAAGTDTDLHWYYDENKINEIPGTAGAKYTPGPRTNYFEVYAAYEENGCTGSASAVEYTVYGYIQVPIIADAQACSADAAMPLLVPSNARAEWAAQWQANGSAAWSDAPLVPERASATYKMRFEGEGKCISTETNFRFTYINPPVPSATITPDRLCLGDAGTAQVRVSAAGSFAGIETLYPGGSQSSTDKVFSLYAEKIYEGQYTSRSYQLMENGSKCWSAASAPAGFKVIDAITPPQAVNQPVGCEGGQLFLEATAASQGDVLHLSVSENGSGLVPELAPGTFDISGYAGTGTSTFYLWAVNGCPSEKVPVKVTVHPAPEPFSITVSGAARILDNEISVCQGSLGIPEVTASSAGSVLTWTDTLGQPAGSGDGTAILEAPGAGQGAKYRYTLSAVTDAGGCGYEEQYTYRVKPLPVPVIIAQNGFTESDTLCKAALYRTYSIEGYSATGNYEWLMPSQGLVQIQYPGSSGEKSPMRAVPLAEGIDTLRLRQELDGCADTAEMQILIVPKTEAALSVTTDAMGGRVLLYNESATQQSAGQDLPQSFVWKLEGTRESQSYEKFLNGEATVWNVRPGDRSVWLISANGGGGYCADSARLDFYMPAVTGLYPPTALSPRNGRSPVAVWSPAGYGLEKYEVWVYDNWGNLIWYSNKLENTSPAEGWDGRDANGNIVEGDVFTYRIRARFADGSQWKNSEGKEFGSIHLLK